MDPDRITAPESIGSPASHVAIRVANAVDPNYTIVAKFPKKYLPKN